MALSARRHGQSPSAEIQPYHARAAVEWGQLREGCILWIRTEASVHEFDPSLTAGLQMDKWVYDHPCVVLSFHQHAVKRQIVCVAPVCFLPVSRFSVVDFGPVPFPAFAKSLRLMSSESLPPIQRMA